MEAERNDRLRFHRRGAIGNGAGLDECVVARGETRFGEHDLDRGRISSTDKCRNPQRLALEVGHLLDLRLGDQHVWRSLAIAINCLASGALSWAGHAESGVAAATLTEPPIRALTALGELVVVRRANSLPTLRDRTG